MLIEWSSDAASTGTVMIARSAGVNGPVAGLLISGIHALGKAAAAPDLQLRNALIRPKQIECAPDAEVLTDVTRIHRSGFRSGADTRVST